jgi:hypothetical protein
VVDDFKYYRYRSYLFHESILRDVIMRNIHDTPLLGNPRYFRTYQHIKERFSWEGLKDDVLTDMSECMTFH